MPRRYFVKRFRRRRHGIPPIILPLLLAAALSACFFRYVSIQLRPAIKTMAVSKATNLIAAAANAAVDDCLTSEQMDYDDFVRCEADDSGRITSLTGRVRESSLFRRMVVEHIADRLEAIGPEELGIPLGNLTGRLLLSDLGPDVRVRLQAVGDVTGEYENSFVAAGVNQTLHRISLKLSMTVYLLIPGEIVPVHVDNSICVAETVIVGEVPDTYVNLNEGEKN